MILLRVNVCQIPSCIFSRVHGIVAFLLITLAVDNETMLGLKKAEAGNDLVDVKKSKKLVKKSKVEEQDEDEEEWGGIDLEAMKE